MQIEFAVLDKTPNLEFVVLTDPSGQLLAGLISDQAAWRSYHDATIPLPPGTAASWGCGG